MLQRTEAGLPTDQLKSCVPESSARYHFFLFKHHHNGDYLESVGALVPHAHTHRTHTHTHTHTHTTNTHTTRVHTHRHMHTTHTHTHTHTRARTHTLLMHTLTTYKIEVDMKLTCSLTSSSMATLSSNHHFDMREYTHTCTCHASIPSFQCSSTPVLATSVPSKNACCTRAARTQWWIK